MAISSQSPQSPPPVRKVHGMFHNLIDLVASSIPEARRPVLRSSSNPMPPPTYGPRTEQWRSSPKISRTLSTWTKYTQILIHMYNADIPDPENHGAILHHKENLPEWKGWDVYDAATVRSDKDRIKLQVLREICKRLAAAKAEHAFRQAIRAAKVRMPFSPQSTSELLEREDELMDVLYPGFAGSDEAEMYGRWIEASAIDEGDTTMYVGQSGVRVRQRGDEAKSYPLFIPGKKISEQATTQMEGRPTLVDVSTPNPLIPRTAPINFSVPKGYPQIYPALPSTQPTKPSNYVGGRPSDVVLHQTPDFTICYRPTPSPLHQSLPKTPLPPASHLIPADRGINPLGSHPPMMATPSPLAMPPAQYQPQLSTMGYNLPHSQSLKQQRSQKHQERRRQRYHHHQQQQGSTNVAISPGGTHHCLPIAPTTVSDNTTIHGTTQGYSHSRPQPHHQVLRTNSDVTNTTAELPSTSNSNPTASSPSFSAFPRQFFLADYQGYGGARSGQQAQQAQQTSWIDECEDQGYGAQQGRHETQAQLERQQEQHISYTSDMMSPPPAFTMANAFGFTEDR